MKNESIYIKLVDDALKQLGIDPRSCRSDDPKKWYLHRGTAQLVILVKEAKNHRNEPQDIVVILSPLVFVPEDEKERKQLLAESLYAAHQMITESFSIAQEPNGLEVLYISASLPLSDCSSNLLAGILESLSYYALHFSQKFRDKYLPENGLKEEPVPFKL